ncbi:MAG: type II secretion system minor pseudopilin GspK [Gammaproteobacteria bacterium]|nr:MAG: type II secretion system minor pseudopilin GspK [Gammaproteobacteria bacterium]
MLLSRSKILRPVSAKHQQGVAIITALLIVTIAATVSITISTRLQLDVRRTGNLIAQDQAQFYLLAAEEWSQRILRQDKKDSTSDSLDESWAIQLPPLPVDGGSIQGTLTDLHACINVNSLVEGGAVDAITKARLSQLFRNLGVKNDLTQAITDWIDRDLETTNPNGAEDGYYLNLQTPYRTANTPLHSISELRLIKGFENSKTYALVKPYLCAYIINGDEIAINVNTASAEVLQSLSAKMTKSLAADIIEQRKNKPFNDLKEFTKFAKLGTIIKDTTKLSTSSDYFLLRTQAIIGQANKVMYSVIYRDESGKTKIISRTLRTL